MNKRTGKLLLICVVLSCSICLSACDSQDYKKANALFDSGNYEEALTLYEKVDDYEDAKQKASVCRNEISLLNADKLYDSEDFEKALPLYLEIADYTDVSDKISICKKEISFKNAELLYNKGDFENALPLYLEIVDYKDVNDKISICKNEIALTNAQNLLSNKQYENALDYFATIDKGTEYYDIAFETIYETGLKLFEEKEYALCVMYMNSLSKYKDSSKYAYVAGIYNALNINKKISYCGVASNLKSYADTGFLPAEELVNQEPFSDYLPLMEKAGLYRSDDKFLRTLTARGITMMKYDVNGYISISPYANIKSSSYMSETVAKITDEKVRNDAQKNNYSCECTYIGDGIYHCDVKYKDSIDKTTYSYSFDMTFVDEKLVVSAFKTSEPKNIASLIDGTYSKIE